MSVESEKAGGAEDAAPATPAMAERASVQARLAGSNISEQTFLATDYLNHFNEIVMLLDLIPDMPECFEDAREWQPKSYKQHFADSSVADRELAILAYDHVPVVYRKPFETTIGHMDELVLHGLTRIEKGLAEGDMEKLREEVTATSRAIQRLVDVASAIIHGSTEALHQDEIDSLLGK